MHTELTIMYIPAIGCLVVVGVAMVATYFQYWLHLNDRAQPAYAWGALVSGCTAVFAATSLAQYHNPSDLVVVFSERLQYTTFPLIAFGLCGFVLAYHQRPLRHQRLLVGALALMVGVLWLTDLVITNHVLHRHLSFLVSDYPEPAQGPLGMVYVGVSYFWALYSLVCWIRLRGRAEDHRLGWWRDPYVLGFSLWAITALHDGLVTMGMPTLLYLMSYGVLGFNLAVMLTTAGDYARVREMLRQYRNTLEERVAERTAELEALNRRLVREMAERREAEAHNLALAKQLQQAQKMEALGTLAGGIAHDFNNILGAIMGFCELAADKTNPGQPIRDDLEEILQASLRAKHLIRQILTFSRKAEGSRRSLDLNRVAEDTARLLGRTMPKTVALEMHLAPGLALVWADPNQLQQALLNLAANAVDAMPRGGVLEMGTQAMPGGDVVALRVADTGAGIAPEHLDKIYDPFFTTKEVGKGTGLGLSMVYGIITGLGGRVECRDRRPGPGTEFRLLLPVYRGRESGAAPGDEVGAGADLDLLAPPGGSVLLVDDDPALGQAAAAMLDSQGYEVWRTFSAEEALEVYAGHQAELDVVVMDLGMPGMGGLELLPRLVALNPEARIIVATGYGQYADGGARELINLGAVAVVAKPFRRTELLRAVKGALGTGQ